MLPSRMPAALLAVLLLAATVDPRLEEPLKLLAEVGAGDATSWASRSDRSERALSRPD